MMHECSPGESTRQGCIHASCRPYRSVSTPSGRHDASFLIDCSTQDLIDKVQRVQNGGLRVCKYNNLYERCSVTELHTHFNLSRLADRRHKQLLTHMYKLSKTKGYTVPPEEARTRGDSKVKFKLKNVKLKTMQKSPLYRGTWEWDDLIFEVQNTTSKVKFKGLIKYKKTQNITSMKIIASLITPPSLTTSHSPILISSLPIIF